MRRPAIRTILILSALLIAPGPALSQTLQHRAIDAEHSKAQFSVSHIWVENVAGTVPIARGDLVLRSGSAIPVSVSAVLDATKIQTGEADRDNALRSADFFDTARFSQWTFTSTNILPKGPSAFEMDGNLTIRGVTQPERLNVTVSGDPGRPVYHATGRIDRHAFGMPVTRLDPVIGNPVDVTLDIALK